MAEKKKQHYVPQLYLRYFSHDKKRITVFSIKENKILSKSAPIKGQCYENFMYSKNPKFEDSICLMESVVSKIFNNIFSSKEIPKMGKRGSLDLLAFILFQSARTLFSKEQTNEMINKLVKTLIKNKIKFNNPNEITEEDIDKVKVVHNQPALFNLSVISTISPILMDGIINCKLIINNKNDEFITSDNPVIIYNKYHLNNKTGFACPGLIILFPLSPKYYLIYYDSLMYKVGSSNSGKSVIKLTQKDIDELNILQLINANNTAYTLGRSEQHLQHLFSKAEKYRFTDKSILNKAPLINCNGEIGSELLHITRPYIKYDADISFIKINKKIPWNYREQYARRPQLAVVHDEFCNKVYKKEYKASEWRRFLKETA
ncbi:MAG: DUF4238 domain-containing protein [Candidatus Margulisbacteria bacterium]|nr:DUF4238 domain-containing protein [Candidatus Margulisiibacteriota bacterium]